MSSICKDYQCSINNELSKKRFFISAIFISLSVIFIGCVGQQHVALPKELKAPEPIAGNSGLYMCPYTSDGVMAEWTDKAINAKIGSTVGSVAGAYAGQKALEQVPFVGGLLGQQVGEKIGREVAIKSCGGMEYIKETSDLSFNNIDQMAVYLYVKHSSHEHYQSALNAAQEIYPELKTRYSQALIEASK
ncbi:MAG: hypothetical protein HQK67_12700 [Desulfamplus sp.]|nr:hypothetical protein [Desulfamplus sp.]